MASMPKKAKRSATKQSRIRKPGRHALHSQIVGLVKPFVAEPSVAQHLVDALPSQKFTVRSRLQAVIPASGSMFGGISPSCFTDTNEPSGFVTTFVSADPTGSQFGFPIALSTQAGTDWKPTGSTGSLFTPTRPYGSLDGRTARLVSYGLRIRYTGAGLYANGTLKLLATPHGEARILAGTTYREIVDLINGSHHTQMKSIYDKAVYEFSFVGNPTWNPYGLGADQDALEDSQRLGQASSPYTIGEVGCVFWYANSTTNPVQFEIELVEHWEIRDPTLASFYSESHSSPELHHAVMNIVNTAHTKAGLQSEKKFANIVSDVAKASKSPLGKAVLAAALA